MNVSRNVIADLLPMVVAGECSEDSKTLVEEYLREHPEERKELKTLAEATHVSPPPLGKTTEVRALARTRKLLRTRSYVLAAAIFFSLLPFSFLYANGRFYWLFLESPGSAAVYAFLAIAGWTGYALLKRKTADL